MGQYDYRPPRPTGVGDIVLWYRQGNTNGTPCAALITADDERGCLPMCVFLLNSRNPQIYSGVHYKGDPWCDTHREAVIRSGVWDYLPNRGILQGGSFEGKTLKEPVEVAKQTEEAPFEQPPDAPVINEAQTRIENLHAKGKNTREIAELMSAETGRKWTWQAVSKILKGHKKELISNG